VYAEGILLLLLHLSLHLPFLSLLLLLSTLRRRKWHVSADAADTTNTARLSEAFGDRRTVDLGVHATCEGRGAPWALTELMQCRKFLISLTLTAMVLYPRASSLHFSDRPCDGLDGLGDDAQERLQQLLQMIKDPCECSGRRATSARCRCTSPSTGVLRRPTASSLKLAPDAMGDGLFVAFSGKRSKVRFNLNEVDYRQAPPAADFQAYAAFDTNPTLTKSQSHI
jgi:hypothetical protein